jgi:hypothetical protein
VAWLVSSWDLVFVPLIYFFKWAFDSDSNCGGLIVVHNQDIEIFYNGSGMVRYPHSKGNGLT